MSTLKGNRYKFEVLQNRPLKFNYQELKKKNASKKKNRFEKAEMPFKRIQLNAKYNKVDYNTCVVEFPKEQNLIKCTKKEEKGIKNKLKIFANECSDTKSIKSNIVSAPGSNKRIKVVKNA